MLLVSTMHITSSIFVNDQETGLWSDILAWVEQLARAGLNEPLRPCAGRRASCCAVDQPRLREYLDNGGLRPLRCFLEA
jgi:hypothetical protein